MANFGLFHSPERKLIFDITDFDETEIAPWEWDIKRLGASLEICGRERGFDSKVRRAIVKTAAEAYREAMRSSPAWERWMSGTPIWTPMSFTNV